MGGTTGIERQAVWPEYEQRHGCSGVVRAGDYLYVSGTIALVPGAKPGDELPLASAVNMDFQLRQVYDNLRAILARFGVGLEQVVAETVLTIDLELAWLAGLGSVYPAACAPARTVAQVAALRLEDAMLEVSCVAYLGGGER